MFLKSKDPVCGLEVKVSKLTRRYHLDGLNFYFCSPKCLQMFVGEPLTYVFEPEECNKKSAGESHHHGEHLRYNHG